MDLSKVLKWKALKKVNWKKVWLSHYLSCGGSQSIRRCILSGKTVVSGRPMDYLILFYIFVYPFSFRQDTQKSISNNQSIFLLHKVLWIIACKITPQLPVTVQLKVTCEGLFFNILVGNEMWYQKTVQTTFFPYISSLIFFNLISPGLKRWRGEHRRYKAQKYSVCCFRSCHCHIIMGGTVHRDFIIS